MASLNLVGVADLVALEPEIDQQQATALIDHAEALAVSSAPCIVEPGFSGGAAVRAILTGAVLRWYHAGSGEERTQSAGPFSQNVRATEKRFLLWPSEIKMLRQLCGAGRSRVFSVSMVP